MPSLVEFDRKYRSRGLVVCGINIDDSKPDVLNFIQQYGITFTTCLDPQMTQPGVYQVSGYPTNYVIDKTGKIQYAGAGFDAARVESKILELLGSEVTVTSITPSSGTNGGTIDITELTGEGFAAGATVKLTKAGQNDITATDVSIVSAAFITCKFDLTGAAGGKWNVVVTNTDGGSGSLNEGFTVESSIPSVAVTSITPNSGANTGTVSITNLAGTGFAAGAAVKLTKTGQDNIPGTDVSVVSATKITCKFNLSGRAAGKWNVVVTNLDKGSGTLAEGFTIINTPTPVPTVTGITPNSALNSGLVGITNLAGTGFVNGATVKLTKTGQDNIPGTDVVVVSATKITCTFDLTDRLPGAWNVAVTTPGGSATLEHGFTIIAAPVPAPTVTGITPNSAFNSGVVNISNLAGTAFRRGATARLVRGEQSIQGTDVTVVSSSKITCAFSVAGAQVGSWGVEVVNPDGQSSMLQNGFTVSAVPLPAPIVTEITPNSGVNSESVSITNLAGSSFRAGATVKLAKIGQPEIIATDVVVVSSTKITCKFDLTGKAVGAYRVVVTNSDGQSGTMPTFFTVNDAAEVLVTVTGITPDSGINVGNVQITNLAGTGFRAGATVKLTKPGQPDIAASDVNVESTTKITCSFDLTDVANGNWSVVVTNVGGRSGSRANAFTVNRAPKPAPTLSSITPNSGLNSGIVEITNLAGTGFQDGATVKLVGTGEAAATVIEGTNVVVTPTKITCKVNLTDKKTGKYDVVVKNPDLQSATLPRGFTVAYPPDTAPTITSIDPNSGAAGGVVSVTDLLGTHLRVGATVLLQKSNPAAEIQGREVNVLSDTKIACIFEIGRDAALGKWNVKVINPDGQFAVLSEAFTIIAPLGPPPTVTSIVPNSRVNTGALEVTNLAGTGFLAGASVKLTKTGQPNIAATNVTVVSSTKITCRFDLYGTAPGKWSVVVTNPDKQTGKLSEAVTVLAAPASPPTVTGITPASGVNSGRVSISAVVGSNFLAGARVKLTKEGEVDIVGSDIVLADSTKITCKFDLTSKKAGEWNVVVTNPDGQVCSLAKGFTITQALKITGITPSSGVNTGVVSITNLAGTGFLSDATVKLTKTGRSDIFGTTVNVVSSTKITCNFDLTGAAVGRWNVVVSNRDGQTATLAERFAVTDVPGVVITVPTTESKCSRNCSFLDIAGTASGVDGIASVKWSTDRGGSGNCQGTANWTAGGINLLSGQNVITVTATNASGQATRDTLTVSYTPAQPGQAWQGLAMVSVPIVPDEIDPKQVVGFSEKAWCTYLAASRTYASYADDPRHVTWFDPRSATPGRGFWARFAGSSATPYGVIPAQDREAAIHLYSGWNLIGQPFISAVKWDTSKILVEAGGVRKSLGESNDSVERFAWGWDPVARSYYLVCEKSLAANGVDTLAPWQAYWVKAKRECNLIFGAK